MKWRHLLFVAAVFAAGACDKDSTGPDIDPIDGMRLEVLGLGTVFERFTAEVAVLGEIAYTTTWSNRGGNPGNVVKIWDISEPVPVLIDSLRIREADTTSDVQVSDDGALLVVSTEYADSGSIVIYDLEDPRAPQRLARHASLSTAPGGVHTVKLGRVDGNLYAFLALNGHALVPPGLAVVDLSDPSNPVEILTRAMGRPFLHDVFVRDGLLFTALWNDGLGIYDIGGGGRGGSPADPKLISRIETVGAADSLQSRAHNIWWYHDPGGSNRYVFVGEEGPATLGAFSSGDIHVVDIADIENPIEVAFFTVEDAGTHNFQMDETAGLLYAAYYNGGVRVIDVSGDLGSCDAEHRDDKGRCDMRAAGRQVAFSLAGTQPLAVWGVALSGDRILASDMYRGLYVLDGGPLFDPDG